MESYQKARFKLINRELIKLKSAAKNNSGAALRITKKRSQKGEFRHELFLTKR